MLLTRLNKLLDQYLDKVRNLKVIQRVSSGTGKVGDIAFYNLSLLEHYLVARLVEALVGTVFFSEQSQTCK